MNISTFGKNPFPHMSGGSLIIGVQALKVQSYIKKKCTPLQPGQGVGHTLACDEGLGHHGVVAPLAQRSEQLDDVPPHELVLHQDARRRAPLSDLRGGGQLGGRTIRVGWKEAAG